MKLIGQIKNKKKITKARKQEKNQVKNFFNYFALNYFAK